jgi:anti-sigma B factor antagonist
VVIDLAEVTFIDSTALGVLIGLRNSAQEINKQVILANVPRRVRRILALTGLDVVFGVGDLVSGIGEAVD